MSSLTVRRLSGLFRIPLKTVWLTHRWYGQFAFGAFDPQSRQATFTRLQGPFTVPVSAFLSLCFMVILACASGSIFALTGSLSFGGRRSALLAATPYWPPLTHSPFREGRKPDRAA
jgi:hypothetical protein